MPKGTNQKFKLNCFGKEAMLIPVDEGPFTVNVDEQMKWEAERLMKQCG